MNNCTMYRKGSGLYSDMDRIFDGLFSNRMDHAGRSPAVDVKESDEHYELIAEVPGLDQKDVDVRIDDKVLIIEAKKEFKEDSEDDNGNYLLRERRNISFSRSFRVPQNADQDKITAEYANGILTLHIPKREEAKPRSIAIT